MHGTLGEHGTLGGPALEALRHPGRKGTIDQPAQLGFMGSTSRLSPVGIWRQRLFILHL